MLFESVHSGTRQVIVHRLAVVARITMFVCVCAGLKPDGEMKLRAVYDFTGSGVNEATVCEFV